MELNALDKQLVALLQEDCKKTTKQYADALQLSKTAVYERIRRLERTGVITGYVALLDKSKVNRDFTVLCHIRLVQHTKENVLRFEREILKLEEVSECFPTHRNASDCIRTHPNASEQVQTRPKTFKNVRKREKLHENFAKTSRSGG